jgi:hypothetical protein
MKVPHPENRSPHTLVWMLIRGHPDFLILPLASVSAVRKRGAGLKPEVQGLWDAIVKKSKESKD